MLRLSVQEINALVGLAERAPKSSAEALWLTALVERVNGDLEAQAAVAKDDAGPEAGAVTPP